MSRYLGVCPKCYKLTWLNSWDEVSCSDCGAKVFNTGFSEEVWNGYNRDKQREIINRTMQTIQQSSPLHINSNMIECIQCHKMIARTSKFCPECGRDLRVSNTKVCPTCGQLIPEDAKFCPECGTVLNMPIDTAVLESEPVQEQHTSYKETRTFSLDDIPRELVNKGNRKNTKYSKQTSRDKVKIKNKKKSNKRGIWFLVGVVLLLWGLIKLGSDPESAKQRSDAEKTVATQSEEQSEVVNTRAKELYESGEYAFITLKDLYDYAPNMEGQKILIVCDIQDIKDNMLQFSGAEGYMMSSIHLAEGGVSSYKEKEKIAVLGVVGETTKYLSMGHSTEINDAYVLAKKSDAAGYESSSSDATLAQYFVVTDEVANNAGANNISEEEYKALCQPLDYESVLRTPDSFDGKYCVLTGSIDQIVEGWFNSVTLYVVDGAGNKWGCVYTYSDGEAHFLEGDNVTLYGKCGGTENVNTVLGKQVVIPRIDVEYINK